MLDPESETFVVHVASLSFDASSSSSPLDVDPIAGLIAKEAPTKVPVEYVDFADVFSPDLASELPEHTGINDYSIELVDANGLIRSSKSPAGLPSFSTGSRTDPFGSVSIGATQTHRRE